VCSFVRFSQAEHVMASDGGPPPTMSWAGRAKSAPPGCSADDPPARAAVAGYGTSAHRAAQRPASAEARAPSVTPIAHHRINQHIEYAHQAEHHACDDKAEADLLRRIKLWQVHNDGHAERRQRHRREHIGDETQDAYAIPRIGPDRLATQQAFRPRACAERRAFPRRCSS